MYTEEEKFVDTALFMAKITPQKRAFGYIKEAVLIASSRPEAINNITKDLYPAVGKKFESTGDKVERTIRNAIISSCKNGGMSNMFSFLCGENICEDRPTVGEFIAFLSDKLLQLKFSKRGTKKK